MPATPTIKAPVQHPLLDLKTGKLTEPWLAYFAALDRILYTLVNP